MVLGVRPDIGLESVQTRREGGANDQMIRVHRLPISQRLKTALSARQHKANEYGPQDARIDRAWKNFRRTKTGRAVYQALRATFRSKCAFCERVNAKTADHFYPKDRYPTRMFRWPNLLLCCAECNPVKGNYFPFVNRRPVLVDPTRDDPLDFFSWDMETGALIESVDPVRGVRARMTRDRLKLDEGPLRDERRVQLNRVLYLLSEVVNQHPAIRLESRQRLEEELHPDRPYLGIIRFLEEEPNRFRPIVDEARKKLPEIDTWMGAWL
jgi:uncharacterized protein (TIGR02646 family)